jgi:hypothetical protein
LNANTQINNIAARPVAVVRNFTRLMMALTLFCGMMASHNAQAQNLSLPAYTNYLTLTDGITHQSQSASLGISKQDKAGNLTGSMVMNNTVYQVSGKLTWAGAAWPNWYSLDITATNEQVIGYFPVTMTYQLSDWVYDTGSGQIEFLASSYDWSKTFVIWTTDGDGAFQGYGFMTPR